MTDLDQTSLTKRMTGFVGAIAIAASMSLPAFAQVTPRPTSPNPGRPSSGQTPGLGNPNTPGVPGGVGNPTTPGVTPTRPNTPTNRQSTTLSPLDREFAIMAAQGNNAEIVTSQLALQRSRNENVRQFAQRMIQEHTQANQRLEALARERNITLPRDAGAFNNAVAQRLSELSGSEFDQAYMGTQVNAHLRTLGLLQTQIQQGQDRALQSYASQVLPNVQDHLQVAGRIAPNFRAETLIPGAGGQSPILPPGSQNPSPSMNQHVNRINQLLYQGGNRPNQPMMNQQMMNQPIQ